MKAKILQILTLSAAVIGLSLATPSLVLGSDCYHQGFHLNDYGGVTSSTLQVRSGSICAFHMQIPSSGVGNAGIISTTPTVRPKNGILGRRSVRIFAYKPNDGFTGNDHFEILVRFDRDNGKGEHETTLSMDVTVY